MREAARRLTGRNTRQGNGKVQNERFAIAFESGIKKSPQAARSSKCQDFGYPPWWFHLLPEEKRSKVGSNISVRRPVVGWKFGVAGERCTRLLRRRGEWNKFPVPAGARSVAFSRRLSRL